jgi:hypothetical protein
VSARSWPIARLGTRKPNRARVPAGCRPVTAARFFRGTPSTTVGAAGSTPAWRAASTGWRIATISGLARTTVLGNFTNITISTRSSEPDALRACSTLAATTGFAWAPRSLCTRQQSGCPSTFQRPASALRDRADFRTLVTELEKKAVPKK